MASATSATDSEQASSPERDRIRIASYIGIVALTMIAGAVAMVRLDGIFACPASYERDSYLAYCQAGGYGDYDHGGIWFGMEPAVTRGVAGADVLFLGSS